jgi:tetratricopeptide (TPR) repeat protein
MHMGESEFVEAHLIETLDLWERGIVTPSEGLRALALSLKPNDSEEWKRAEKDLIVLEQRKPFEFLEQRIIRAFTRFRGPLLVRLLVDEGVESLLTDHRRSDKFQRFAELVCHQSPRLDEMADAFVGVRALRGALLKIRGRFEEAFEIFERVETHFDRCQVADLVSRGHSYFLGGSFWKDTHAFKKAGVWLQKAGYCYRLSGYPDMAVRPELTRSSLLHLQGDFVGAIRCLEDAEASFTAAADPWLTLMRQQNLVIFHCENDSVAEAERIFKSARALYELAFAGDTEAVEVWFNMVVGRLEFAKGRFAEAERRYLKALGSYDANERVLDVVVLSLELLRVYCSWGNLVRADAVIAVIVDLSSNGLHREAAKAAKYVAEQCRRRTLTDRLILQFALYLQRTKKVAQPFVP